MGQIPPELIGRAVQDADFRRRLLNDPEDVLKTEGYQLDPEQIETLRRLDPKVVDRAIEALVGEIDGTKWG